MKPTLRYIGKRFLWSIPTLWLLASLTFFVLRFIPGGPFDQERQLPPEIKANLAASFGLDQPLPVQYARYLKGLLRGDLGPSLKYRGRTVRDILVETLPVSAQLGTLALVMALVFGLPLGIWSGALSRSPADRAVLLITTLGISLPNFVLAACLVTIFSLHLQLLPPALWEGVRYAILPAATLALYPLITISRFARSAVRETLTQDFVRTARSLGIPEKRILRRHVLKNALSPVISMLGPLTATLITGSFIVEQIFAIPGMGQHFVTAVTNRDYPLVLGVTLVYAVIVIAMNLIVDLLYPLLDPRVRLT